MSALERDYRYLYGKAEQAKDTARMAVLADQAARYGIALGPYADGEDPSSPVERVSSPSWAGQRDWD